MENIKNWLKILAIFAYAFVVVIASAGAMNYGHTNGEGIYMAMGGLNLIAGIWTAYKAYHKTQEG